MRLLDTHGSQRYLTPVALQRGLSTHHVELTLKPKRFQLTSRPLANPASAGFGEGHKPQAASGPVMCRRLVEATRELNLLEG
jgi:hypothetical protein